MGIRFHSDTHDDIGWHNPIAGIIGSWDMDSGVATSWTTAGYYAAPWQPQGLGNFVGGTSSPTDVVFVNTSTGEVGVWEIVNGAAVSWTSLGYGGGDWQLRGEGSTGSVDLTGDGYTDIVWENATTGEVGMWDVFNGAATWQSLGVAGGGWDVEFFGDVVGDASDDIIFRNTSTGDVGAWSVVSGTVQWTYLGSAPLNWQIFGTGDFTGDGFEDILWTNTQGGEFGIWDGTASGFEWRSLGYFDNTTWAQVGIGDYTGDGQDDLLWQTADGHIGFTDISGGDSLTQTWNYLGNVGTDWFAV